MTIVAEPGVTASATRREPARRRRQRRLVRLLPLLTGAVIFLFPFYYMIIVSLRTRPELGLAGLVPTGLGVSNYSSIDAAIDLGRCLLNSAIFTGGVLVATVLCGLPAGYALAHLEWRMKGALFYSMLIAIAVPFQLLMIPLYVMMARDFGLADSYLGMILPFAINGTAVFIFRNFFLQLPRELLEAARIDGASELRVLTAIAVPLVRPAIVTALLITFIGPWNELLWPLLITKQAYLQPLAVAISNFMQQIAQRYPHPEGPSMAGAVVLVLPVIVLFITFQRQFAESGIGSSLKG